MPCANGFSVERSMRRAMTLVSLATIVAGTVSSAAAQDKKPKGFNLFALPDYAATGMRSATGFRFFVSNAGPMDVQQNVIGAGPAEATRSGTRFRQFNEVTLFAA